MLGLIQGGLPGLDDIESETKQKIELYISCRKLKNLDLLSLSDPFARVYIHQGNKKVLIGQTEVINDNLNPNFSKTFKLDYIFEDKQPITVELLDLDGKDKFERIGSASTTLGELMGSNTQTLILNLQEKNHNTGKLILRAEVINGLDNEAKIEIHGKNLNVKSGILTKPQIFFRLKRTLGDFSEINTYESEPSRSEINPHWKQFQISLHTLCNNNFMKAISLEVFYKKGSEAKKLGECSFTVNQLLYEQIREMPLINTKDNKPQGSIEFTVFSVIEKSSFLEYLRGGVQLNVMVGIDFTSSNKDPKNPASLHAIRKDEQLNDYQAAINDVCDILLCYDYDKKVPVYGFGGKPEWRYGIDHCFALSGNDEDPYVDGLDGILGVYKKCLSKITLGQPTLFGELLGEAVKIATKERENGSKVYTILLILTDGIIHDMNKTIDTLVDCSRLPLSVIIVGVGNEDFEQMKVLDGDEEAVLHNSKGYMRERDLVQFVSYNELKSNNKKLAKEILAELPRQFLEYMKLVNVKPQEAKKIDLDKLDFATLQTQYDDLNFAPRVEDASDTARRNLVSSGKLPKKSTTAVSKTLGQLQQPSQDDDDLFAVPEEPVMSSKELKAHHLNPFKGKAKSMRELDVWSYSAAKLFSKQYLE